MLEIKQVGKRFGGANVLDGVSLQLREGEFYSLLGPSGCGKTTLLRIIAGFEHPDRGDVLLDGRTVSGDGAHMRPFNMVFQRYALFPHLDVAGNVHFGLRMKGVKGDEAKRRVAEALALVSLEGFESRRTSTLSGGQQQRVALARALVNRPRILLLDEPLSALDLKLRQRMQAELRALQRRLGMTFLFVTHAQDEALALSDRIAVMNGGRIDQMGAPQALYEHPETAFVATFVGNVNRLAGRVTRVDGALAHVEAGATRIVGRAIAGLVAGVARDCFVRPERVRLGDASGDRNAVAVEVSQVHYRGATIDVEMRLRDHAGTVWTATFSGTAGIDLPRVGAQTHALFAPEDCSILDGGP